jgi:hypothetical protein
MQKVSPRGESAVPPHRLQLRARPRSSWASCVHRPAEAVLFPPARPAPAPSRSRAPSSGRARPAVPAGCAMRAASPSPGPGHERGPGDSARGVQSHRLRGRRPRGGTDLPPVLDADSSSLGVAHPRSTSRISHLRRRASSQSDIHARPSTPSMATSWRRSGPVNQVVKRRATGFFRGRRIRRASKPAQRQGDAGGGQPVPSKKGQHA